MDHQQRIVEKARIEPHLGIFCDAGTGKTGTMVRILAEDFNGNGRIRNTLIFAPLTVCSQWPGEFKKFSMLPDKNILVLTGPGKERVAALSRAMASQQPVIVVTNYESVLIKPFYEALLKWCPEILVLDEAHRIKDSQSKRAKAIYPLARAAKRRFLLTGTPVVNSLLDLFGQYRALDPSIFGPGFWSFRSRYFYDRNAGKQFTYPDWVPHKEAAKEIGAAIKKTSVRVTRDECLQLPPLSHIPVPITLSKTQQKAYDELKKDFITEHKDAITSSDFEMVKTLRMQQVLCGFLQPDDTREAVWFDDQPRIDALLDLADSIGKEKAIIWTVFRPSYKKIREALEKEGHKVAALTGEQSNPEKLQAIEDFTKGDTQFLIANPAAASEGINLQEAKYAIYFMRSWNLLHYLQSMARNYRSGTEKFHSRVIHFHLVAKGTLDEAVASALVRKQNLGDSVLKWAHGKTSEWTDAIFSDESKSSEVAGSGKDQKTIEAMVLPVSEGKFGEPTA